MNFLFPLLLGAWLPFAPQHAGAQVRETEAWQADARIKVQTHQRPDDGRISKGTFTVPEDRSRPSGRTLQLDFVVLHATGENPRPDPVFVLAGGPGQAAAELYRGYVDAWERTDRDIVLLSQRGTGGSNRLDIRQPEGDDPQSLLDPFFDERLVRQSLAALQQRFDLRMYSTPIAMDDLNEFRQALGYAQINLIGGSYGTRAALVYIRQHEETVRTATLNGVAPIEFINPLYHASEAQGALDKIFDEVESDPTYRRAFPDLRQRFQTILQRLSESPAVVELENRNGGKRTVQLSRNAFAASLRYLLYYMDTSRKVPALIHRAYQGDYAPIAEDAIRRNRALRDTVALGMLLCVTAAEDVARIDPQSIQPLTENTFLGDSRVRTQMAVCQFWPKSDLPPDFDQPVKSTVPTLILSGTLDPVTSPRFGEIVHQNFPNSVHLVAPGAHGVGGACIDEIRRQFLERGSMDGVDTSCVDNMRLPPLYLPTEFAQGGGN